VDSDKNRVEKAPYHGVGWLMACEQDKKSVKDRKKIVFPTAATIMAPQHVRRLSLLKKMKHIAGIITAQDPVEVYSR